MSTITPEETGAISLNHSARYVRNGMIAGLVGGLGFGVVMAVVGMLPMVSMLVRQNNAVIGFLVHMVIAAIIGTIFGGFMGFLTEKRPLVTLTIGVGYGILWWVLGALILMPILLGMPEAVLAVDQMQWYSLLGHVIYGLAVGSMINTLSV